MSLELSIAIFTNLADAVGKEQKTQMFSGGNL